MRASQRAFVSQVVHGLSQPLTALECGLEIGLRQDKTVMELRNRMETLLEIAQTMHQRLVELRARPEAASGRGTPDFHHSDATASPLARNT